MQRLFKIKNIRGIVNFIKHNAQCINSSFFCIIDNPLRYIFFIIPLSFCFFLVLVSYNSQKIIENNFKDSHERIIIFLKNNVSPKDINSIESELVNKFDIISFKYFSEEESLELYKKINEKNDITKNLDYNPLPKTIIIKKNIKDSDADSLSNFLENNGFVDYFNSNIIYLKRIFYFKDILLNLLLFSIFFFLLILIIFINYNTKIEISSNKNKISILYMLGARNSYIRREYIYLPILSGLTCCLIGFIFYKFFYYFFTILLNEILTSFEISSSLLSISFVEGALSSLLVIIIFVIVSIFTINSYINKTLDI